MSTLIIHAHMKALIVSVYVLAFIRVGDLNTVPRRSNESMNLNQTKMVVCIGGKVNFPPFPRGNCTARQLLLFDPHGKRFSNTKGRFTKKDDSWEISGVQASDSGQWKLKRYCDNIETSTVVLEVNCQHVSAKAESTLSLKCPKPSIPVNATNIKREMYCKLSKWPGKKAIKVLQNGMVTDESKRMFGQRLKVGPNDHSLKIDNITTGDEGNYTCLWRWENSSKNRGSRTFTFHMKVTVVIRSPTTPSTVASDSSTSTNSSTVTATSPDTRDAKSSVATDKPSQWILAFLLMIYLSGFE